MKPYLRKTVIVLLSVLLAVGPFLIAPMLNNVKNRHYLDRFLSIELPEGVTPVGHGRYITSNRGDCVHFVGFSIITSSTFPEISSALWKQENTALFPNLDLIVKEREQDTVVLAPFDLSPGKFNIPVTLSVYGSDVGRGINDLLTEGNRQIEKGQRLVILFTTFQEENIFDVRCY